VWVPAVACGAPDRQPVTGVSLASRETVSVLVFHVEQVPPPWCHVEQAPTSLVSRETVSTTMFHVEQAPARLVSRGTRPVSSVSRGTVPPPLAHVQHVA
jgi:hypothetical protein